MCTSANDGIMGMDNSDDSQHGNNVSIDYGYDFTWLDEILC